MQNGFILFSSFPLKELMRILYTGKELGCLKDTKGRTGKCKFRINSAYLRNSLRLKLFERMPCSVYSHRYILLSKENVTSMFCYL